MKNGSNASLSSCRHFRGKKVWEVRPGTVCMWKTYFRFYTSWGKNLHVDWVCTMHRGPTSGINVECRSYWSSSDYWMTVFNTCPWRTYVVRRYVKPGLFCDNFYLIFQKESLVLHWTWALFFIFQEFGCWIFDSKEIGFR